MRMLVARCEVVYEGRLAARLPLGDRLILFKEDGSVSVHAEIGGYKPLNWMTPPTTIVERPGEIRIAKPRAGELLTVRVEEVLSDLRVALDSEGGLVKAGEESELQALIAADPSCLGDGLSLVRREFPTDIGPVDLLCRDADGSAVLVEVKRRGEIAGVEQLCRYLERLAEHGALAPCRGILAAQEVRPQARVLAEARGIDWVEVDLEALRIGSVPALSLF
jgi:hypothetical protein